MTTDDQLLRRALERRDQMHVEVVRPDEIAFTEEAGEWHRAGRNPAVMWIAFDVRAVRTTICLTSSTSPASLFP